ncbi:MAG: glycine oxidase ThiO [Chloroflexi bacterium]|nr:glycine oxidase ThiO [Chloroflexota bacterium]MQG00257.1 glycine oxidase ThiO [SAR202 cluster bacterium]|tara:strand:+ start:1353 stop:2477 length:1125 start_codon:yes stop_codon:yes gene_type:complete
MKSNNSALIIGGGVIGCSIAYHLARENLQVQLLEKNSIAGAASGVAGGFIAPLQEDLPHGATLVAAQESRLLLMESLPRLYEDSGIEVEYASPGILRLAYDKDQLIDLRDRFSWQKDLNMDVRLVSGSEAQELEPGIAGDVIGGLFSPNEGNLNSKRLVRAFAQAAHNKGAILTENTKVTGLILEGQSIKGVNTSVGEFRADYTIICSGSWSDEFHQSLGLDIPVSPVKGQILATRSVPVPISRPVWSGITYLIPKLDGSIVIGTTREHVGFQPEPNIEGISTILSNAIRIVPTIKSASLRKVWAGLRPYTPDQTPIIGKIPGIEGVLLATGHYRSGILMSTITGNIIRELILEGEKEYMLPFNISRFSSNIDK